MISFVVDVVVGLSVTVAVGLFILCAIAGFKP
jgi:hypothetical protein